MSSPSTAEEADTDDALLEATRTAFGPRGALARQESGYRQRPGQQEMAEAIADAIDAQALLMVDAGTGIGKTFAYLVPALLSGKRVLLSTATRQLQDQLHQRDVPRIRQALGSNAAVAVLKGRANYVCPVHLSRALRDGRFRDPQIPARLRIIERFAALSETGDRAGCSQLSEEDPARQFATSTRDNCPGQVCPELRHCPLMKARQQAQKADVLIVNHHLFCADLSLKDDAIGDFLPKADILIFDEAHQLPDIATEFFGNTVSTRQLLDLGRESLRTGNQDAPGLADWPGLYRQLEQVAGRLRLALPPGMLRLGLDELQAADAQDVNEWLSDVLPDVEEVLEDHAEALRPVAAASADLTHLQERTLELLGRLRHWHRAFDRACHPESPPTRPPQETPVSTPSGPEPGGRAGEPAASVFAGIAAELTPASPAEPTESTDDLILWAQTTDNHAQLRTTPLSVAQRFTEQRAHRAAPGSSSRPPWPWTTARHTSPARWACPKPGRCRWPAPSTIPNRQPCGSRADWAAPRRRTFPSEWPVRPGR
ncbi:DEAD/DEAH box helicase [Lautropia mirabilis]